MEETSGEEIQDTRSATELFLGKLAVTKMTKKA